MMRPDAKVQKVYLYPKPVDFRKSINGLAALCPSWGWRKSGGGGGLTSRGSGAAGRR